MRPNGTASVAPSERRTVVEVLRTLLAEKEVSGDRIELACAAVDLLLRRAVTQRPDGSVFVITGDIPAMWLRDSTAQVRPLLALAADVPSVVELVTGVLRTQIEQVLVDPRANAFNAAPTGAVMRRDFRDQSPWVYERKYAIDSLCAPITLAWLIWQTTGSLEHVDDRFREMAARIVVLWRDEQDHEPGSFVLRRRFGRRGGSLSHGGRGAPVGWTGMTWSAFRPSDDACEYGYHIPANALAAASLERLCGLLESAPVDDRVARDARALAEQIDAGILRHGIVDDPYAGRVYAYETDGLGSHLLLDDANPPNLISLPYLGYCDRNDPVYMATRERALSPANPLWVSGGPIHGLGSSHTRRGFVWPLGIAVEGLTGASADEREDALRRLEATVIPELLFRESVDPTDPRRYTRHWFSWADMLYVELVLASAGLISGDSESVR
jgi:meiotically up-regulated gene 157 (Mug157) protein